MKKAIIFSIVGCLGLLHQSYSQDIVLLQKGDVIRAKVVSIDETTIKYRVYENLEGPIYSLSIYEVIAVRYEDGRFTSFTFNMRKLRPWGITFNCGGSSVLFGSSIEYFFKPSWAAEVGLNIVGIHGGIRHHFFGKTTKQWTPYIAAYAYYYNIVFFMLEGFYFPIGIHFINKKGFTFSADAGIMNARLGTMARIYTKEKIFFPYLGVKLGFRLGGKK